MYSLVPMGHRHRGAEQVPVGGRSPPQGGTLYTYKYIDTYLCMYIYIYIYIDR